MRRFVPVGVGLVAFALGALAGAWSRATPDAPQPTPAPGAAVAPSGEDCPPCPDIHCGDDGRATEVPPVAIRSMGMEFEPGPDDVPPPWPDDLPADLTADAWRAALEETVTACGWQHDLVEIDCSSPPCMVGLLTREGIEAPNYGGCAAWTGRFGDTVSQSTSVLLCDDGTNARFQLIGPHSEALQDALPPKDPDDPWAAMRVMRARANAVAARAGCSRPAQLEVENRLGHHLQWVPDP